jgi:hypothetical protein
MSEETNKQTRKKHSLLAASRKASAKALTKMVDPVIAILAN